MSNSNSDYLIKATIKKLTERLNKIFSEKFEDVSNIAQEFPEIITNELNDLKSSVIKEAERMREKDFENKDINSIKEKKILNVLKEIEETNNELKKLNETIEA